MNSLNRPKPCFIQQVKCEDEMNVEENLNPDIETQKPELAPIMGNKGRSVRNLLINTERQPQVIDGFVAAIAATPTRRRSVFGKPAAAKGEDDYEGFEQTNKKSDYVQRQNDKKKKITEKIRDEIETELDQRLKQQNTYTMEGTVTAMCAMKSSVIVALASGLEDEKKTENEPDITPNDPGNDFKGNRKEIDTGIDNPFNGIICSVWILNMTDKEGPKKLPIAEKDCTGSGKIEVLAATTDEKRLILGYEDGSINIYDLEQKMTQKLPAHKSKVSCLTITKDDAFFVSAGLKDFCLKIFNLKSKDEDSNINLRSEKEHIDFIKCLAVTPKYIISGELNGVIRVLDFNKRRDYGDKLVKKFDFSETKNEVHCLSTTSDFRFLVAGFLDRSLKVFDLVEMKLLHDFSASHKGLVYSLAITPDDRYAITRSTEGYVRVFDLQTKEKIQTFKNYSKGSLLFNSVVVTRDGKYIASGCKDNLVKAYEVEQSALCEVIENAHKSGVDNLLFSKKYIVSGSYDGQLRLFDSDSRKEVFSFSTSKKGGNGPAHIKSVAITSDSKLVIAGTDDNSIFIYDTTQQEPDKKPVIFDTERDYFSPVLAVTHDNKYLVSGGGGETMIKIFDLEQNKIVSTYKNAHSGTILCLTLTHDSRYIITGSEDKSILVFNFELKMDIETKPFSFHRAHDGEITCLAATKNNLIVSGSTDGSIKIFDLLKRECVHTFTAAHDDHILSLCVTSDEESDSKYIISGSKDLSIRIFDLENRRRLFVIDKAHDHHVTSVAVSPDNKLIISGSNGKKENSIKIFRNPYYNSKLVVTEHGSLCPLSSYGLFILKIILKKYNETRKKRILSKYPNLLLYPYSFNLFHLASIFSSSINAIQLCLDNTIPFTGDYKGKTPLHYMLNSEQINYKRINFVLENFYRVKDPNFYYKMMKEITSDLPNIISLSPHLAVNILKFAVGPPQSYKNEEVTRFGSIKGRKSRRIMPYESTIFTDTIKDQLIVEGNDFLSIKAILLNMNYDLCSDEMQKLLEVLKDVREEEIFRSKAISVLIDYLWDASKAYHYGLEFIFTILTILLSIYATEKPEERSKGLEVVLIILGFSFLGYELFQLISGGIKTYISDIWNAIDMIGYICLIATIFLSWSDNVEEFSRDWVMSITLFMIYTKWISFLRMIDQTRKLIRMIIEILSDIRSFLVILAFIIMGSSLIFFQFDDDSTSYGQRLLFVYGLVYASFDSEGFNISQIIYLIIVTVMLSVVLLNLLVAIMSDTYERVEASDALTDGLERVTMILETVVMKKAYRKTKKFIITNIFKKNMEEDKSKGYLFFAENVLCKAEEDKAYAWESRSNTIRQVLTTEMQKHYEPLHLRLTDIESELNKQEEKFSSFEKKVEDQIGRLDNQIRQIINLWK